MKLCLLTIAILLHILLPSTNSQPHVIRKRFLWKSLAQLAQPFIRKLKPPTTPQYNPQSYNSPYAAPPVFHVSPSAPQPIRVPPSSGQLYLPLPGQNNYPQNFPQLVQVPPSSYGSSRPVYTQPPSFETLQPAFPQSPSFEAHQPAFQQTPAEGAQWNPLATPSEGGTLFHGMGPPVATSSFSFQTQDMVSDVGNGNLDSLLSGLSDLPASLNAAIESTKIVTDSPPVELATEGPALFLAEKSTSVPSDFIRVILPDDITRELRKRVTIQTLNDQGILLRQDLTEVYLAPSTSRADHPPFGLVSVQLSSQALEFLNEYAQSAVKHGPQLELSRSILEKLSKDSSQRVRLINGGRDTLVKTGSADVFIAPSDQKPPDGYVSIPLSDSAMSELKKNFLGTSLDVQKGIPVRAYIAPADQKLPPGHMSIPLPDFILDSVTGLGLNLDGRSVTEEPALHKHHASVLPESDIAIYLAPSRKQAPSSFRKLKLPETIMESLRRAISATRLADSGTPAKDLTAAYLASTNEFVPPGFLSISVPDTLVKMLDIFSETKDTKKVKESDVEKESDKSTDKNKQSENNDSRDLGVEEGPNITRKIVDALIEAIKRTVKQVVKNTRDEEKKEKEDRRKSGESSSSSRDNARITKEDANDNDFDNDEKEDENIDLYQPQYQMSPFFPSTISTSPYIDPYQYGGLWTYGDVNQWNVNGNPTYGDYGAVGTAQDRATYDGSQVGAMPYLLGQQHYDISNLEKRQGEAVSNVEKGQGKIVSNVKKGQEEVVSNIEKSQEETKKELSRQLKSFYPILVDPVHLIYFFKWWMLIILPIVNQSVGIQSSKHHFHPDSYLQLKRLILKLKCRSNFKYVDPSIANSLSCLPLPSKDQRRGVFLMTETE
uniref:Uncharacterized protein n=1 Tax=Strigamia maritima TaxID=126957 RepID=T1IHF8_STRMM